MTAQHGESLDPGADTTALEVHAVLDRVLATVRTAMPTATGATDAETCWVDVAGDRLVQFTGRRHFVSMQPASTGDDVLDAALAPYLVTRTTARFRLSEPVPYDLIALVVTEHARRAGLTDGRTD